LSVIIFHDLINLPNLVPQFSAVLSPEESAAQKIGTTPEDHRNDDISPTSCFSYLAPVFQRIWTHVLPVIENVVKKHEETSKQQRKITF